MSRQKTNADNMGEITKQNPMKNAKYHITFTVHIKKHVTFGAPQLELKKKLQV